MTMNDDRERLMDGLRFGLQAYQTVLYNRALHPELFTLAQRKRLESSEFEFEAWLTPGGHVLRFERGRICACELVSDQEDQLPAAGVVSALLCAGDREFEHAFERSDVRYMTSVQSETLTENLYLSTYEELSAFAGEQRAMTYARDTAAGPNLSFLDIETYSHEVQVDAYHMQAQGYLVLRTQTIFEIGRGR